MAAAINAWRDGIRRVNAAPAVLAGFVAVTFLLALPFSLAIRGAVEAHLGQSGVADEAADGATFDWWQEFSAQASGLGATLTPSTVGFAAVLSNASGLLDNRPVAASLAGITLGWLVIVSFLTGGIIDRYARRRPTRSTGFFAACGTHVWRFLRLGVIAWATYAIIVSLMNVTVRSPMAARMAGSMTTERGALAAQLAVYAVLAALMAAAAILFDYARIRIVVEDRRSALGALAASGRFIRRHARRVAALFLLNAIAYLALIGAYAALSPAAPRSDIHVYLALALGQAYIIGRHYLKLLVYASQTALFQGELSHAAYTAAPTLVWPESPAVESLTNAGPPAA